MSFWKRQPEDQADSVELNALDRATKALAIGTSRRGFLKKLTVGVGVVSMGALVSAQPAAAATCCGATFFCPALIEDCVFCSAGRQNRWRRYIPYCTASCNFGCNLSTTYGRCGLCAT